MPSTFESDVGCTVIADGLGEDEIFRMGPAL